MIQSDEHEDFVATLESFKELKSGISGSRIRKLTDYVVNHGRNIEALLSFVIQYSKECPPTHKLGSLYIVDSIVRALMSKSETVKQEGEEENYFLKGVELLNDNIQPLLIDGIERSDLAHLEKIQELINIWDKNNVFNNKPLNAARGRLSELVNSNMIPPSSSSNSSLNPRPAPSNDNKSSSGSKIDQVLNAIPKFENLPVIQVPSGLFSEDISVQDSCLKDLLRKLQVELTKNQKLIQVNKQAPLSIDNSTSSTSSSSRSTRSTQYVGRDSRNDRSRSPPRNKNDRSRAQATSSLHSSRQQQQQQQQQSINGQQGNNHHLYPDEQNVPSNPHFRPKPVSFDPTVPRDHVKVYSRTLFVGGVPQNFKEHDIARMLRQFGEVQSVILNNARKHAFVKVYSRAEAERIMAHFTGGGNPTHGLRIRWAVGFGPRDCCDYQYGYSIIPLARLTEIDFKWSQSAEWGGTGGQPIQTNMVYEEPDIIVGEGVSSKAISQKMPTDKGVLGPKSGKVGQAAAVSQTPIPYGNISPPPPPPPVQTSQIPNVPQMQQQYYNQPLYQQPPSMVYGQNQLLGSVSSAQQQQQSHQSTQPPGQKSPQPPQNFDPTAQLNTLMNILNQTPK
ncbi:Nrd1 [Kluyveromyces lactis]|nr:Nrd1 [Kluyveromyces lactis]